jgi:hypothetical protein
MVTATLAAVLPVPLAIRLAQTGAPPAPNIVT